jgi:hypothetical protein
VDFYDTLIRLEFDTHVKSERPALGVSGMWRNWLSRARVNSFEALYVRVQVNDQ